jgi:thiol-disulfide isomerase/thioredoxin
MIQKLIVIAILFSSSFAGFGQAPRPAPTINLKTIDGQIFSLEDYKGKIVLLNFWATWCPPCRQEIPDLIKYQRTYRRQLQVIGVTYPPETGSQVRRFARRARMNYPIALGTKETKLRFASSETLPITVIIDAQGNLHDVIEGIMYRDEFNEKVRPMLSVAGIPQAQKASASKKPSQKVQTRTIIVNSEGYQPSAIRLLRGVPARLTFMRKTNNSCGTEVVIPAYKINRPLPLNVPVVVEFTPNRSGRFKFTCGMDMFRGSILVH